MTVYYIYMIVMALLLAGGIAMKVIEKRRALQSSVRINYNRRRNPFAYTMYRLLSELPLIRKYYGKMMKKNQMLYPGDDIALARRVTKQFLQASGISALAMVFFVALSDGDIFDICLGIWTTMVLFTLIVDTTFENMENDLLLHHKNYISVLRQKYNDTKLLDTAIYMSMENLPQQIRHHIQQIYDIVIAPNTDTQVDRYVQIAPNRFMKMMVAICASIKEYGDKKVDKKSLFTTNLNYLKEDLNVEILKRKKSTFLFSGYVFVSLAPVFLLKPIELWMTSNMGEMKSYYNGAGGTISTVAVFVASYVSYQLVIALKSNLEDEAKDNALLKRITTLPVIQSLLILIENHNYSKTLRIGDALKMTGDKSGTRVFILKRFLVALVCIIAVNVLSGVIMVKQKNELLTDFTNAFENTVVPNDDYRLIMEETAREYTANYQYITGMNNVEQSALLAEKIASKEDIKPKYASYIADTVIEHAQSISGIYYKWWMLILSLIAGVVGYFVPMYILNYKVSVMQMNMEDEVVQFQTLMLILMYEDGVTINEILNWMERFSNCFKESIRKCIVNLELNQQNALKTLRDSESFEPFKQFVDNLLMVDEVNIEGAFADIGTDRDFYKTNRAQENEIQIEKKSAKGKKVAFIPYIVFLGGHILIPFGVYVLNMYKSMSHIFG